ALLALVADDPAATVHVEQGGAALGPRVMAIHVQGELVAAALEVDHVHAAALDLARAPGQESGDLPRADGGVELLAEIVADAALVVAAQALAQGVLHEGGRAAGHAVMIEQAG